MPPGQALVNAGVVETLIGVLAQSFVLGIRAAAPEAWMYGDPENHELRNALAYHYGIAPDEVVVGEGIVSAAGAWEVTVEPLADGDYDVSLHTPSAVVTVTGDTARRQVVDSDNCAKCHEWFEGHGGNRVFNAGSANSCTMS